MVWAGKFTIKSSLTCRTGAPSAPSAFAFGLFANMQHKEPIGCPADIQCREQKREKSLKEKRLAQHYTGKNELPQKGPVDKHVNTSDAKAAGPPYTEDMELVRLVIQKNKRASQQFYDAYAPMLLRRIYRMIGHGPGRDKDAEDALQQVFLEAFRSLPNYQGTGPLGGWLNKIAAHVVMGAIRKQSRLRTLIEQVQMSVQGTVGEEPPLPDQWLAKTEVKHLLWELVQKLPPRKRVAVIMCDLEGHATEHAAQELDIPHGTLISRLYHGRKALRQLLEQESRKQGLNLTEWLDN